MATAAPSPRSFSLEQAARHLKTTPLNVLMHIKRGLLHGVETADGWCVDAASCELLRQQRAKGENTVVCQSHCGKTGGCSSCP